MQPQELSIEVPSQGARRATGEGSNNGWKKPQRFSAQKKTEVVLRLLRGEALDLLSRELGIPAARITAWRKGQIARLEWRDVQDGVIRLSGKTVKHKDVQVLSLAGELTEVIERRRAAKNGSFVFHRNGRPIRDFREAWKRALTKAGVSGYTFHDFRRTATRNMALAGVPDKHIMQVTGHKTTAMLTRYNITVEQDTHKTLVRIQEFLQRAHSSHIGEIGENPETRKAETSP